MVFGTHFVWNEVDSRDYQLILCNFDNNKEEELSAALGIEGIQDELNNQIIDYGGKWSNVLEFQFEVMKYDCSDPNNMYFSRNETREIFSWLTESKDFGWLGFFDGEDETEYWYNCRFSEIETKKVCGETVGFIFSVTCDSPFAYSEVKEFVVPKFSLYGNIETPVWGIDDNTGIRKQLHLSRRYFPLRKITLYQFRNYFDRNLTIKCDTDETCYPTIVIKNTRNTNMKLLMSIVFSPDKNITQATKSELLLGDFTTGEPLVLSPDEEIVWDVRSHSFYSDQYAPKKIASIILPPDNNFHNANNKTNFGLVNGLNEILFEIYVPEGFEGINLDADDFVNPMKDECFSIRYREKYKVGVF